MLLDNLATNNEIKILHFIVISLATVHSTADDEFTAELTYVDRSQK